MVRVVNSPLTILSTSTAATGTAYDVSRTDRWTAQISLATNTGSVVVTIEGSIDGTNYGIINATTKAASTTTYFVGDGGNVYQKIRAKTATQAGAPVVVKLITSGVV